MEIFKSATKVVLLLFAVTTCVGVFTGNIDSATFEKALTVIIVFYFGQKAVVTKIETKK